MTGDLRDFTERAAPPREAMDGRFVRLEPITDESRFAELWQAFSAPGGETLWDYMAYGPFANEAEFFAFARSTYFSSDPLFFAIVPKATGRAAGVAALMRIDRKNGVVEIGNICLSPALQRTREMTEAYRLFFARVFAELGYRRFEWKCNDRNAPSRRAAERLGFAFEGTFRQHMVVKGENRDTAWFAAIDEEWPALDAAYAEWLEDGNFDAEGRQRRSLVEIRRAGSIRP